MAKEMRLTIDENTNKAINKMKAKFLLNDIELTKQAALIEIVREWDNVNFEIKSFTNTIEGKAKDNYLEAINKFEAKK
jgi:hypothetical protein